MSGLDEREAAYWDQVALRLTDQDLLQQKVVISPDIECRLELMGDIAGKKILDVGCGTGLWSVFLAERGAQVWAVDISPVSVQVAERRARLKSVSAQVHCSVQSALELDFPDDFFDIVCGQDIIHHLDPVAFGKEVARVLKESGRAVFKENCANDPLLMFVRNHLCGRFGIPKWSSDDEYPLTKKRRMEFASAFQKSDFLHPEFHYWHYLDAKIFKYKVRPIHVFCHWFDRWIHKNLPFLRQNSYRQVVFVSHPFKMKEAKS